MEDERENPPAPLTQEEQQKIMITLLRERARTDIEKSLSPSALTPVGEASRREIHEKAKELCFMILELAPICKECEMAIRQIEGAVLWVDKGISIR